MPNQEQLNWLNQQNDIENVFACICDLNGTLRGKRVDVDQAEKILDGGMRMPLSVAGVDIWGEDIENSELVFETGDADGVCQPTGRDIVPINWTSKPTALIPLWLYEEGGAPFPGDPRHALNDIVERFKARGLTPVVATELEFLLDWALAIEAFGKGELIRSIFPKRLQSMLIDCKRQEQFRFNRHVTEFEYHSYLETV